MTSPVPLDYPAFYRAASTASGGGQNLYMRSIRTRLVALVASAVGGAISWTLGSFEPLPWLALVGFVVALAAEVVIFAIRPEQSWYEGRAAAESAKTLTWRYAVAGDPFPVTGTNVDAAFRAQLSAVTRDLTVILIPDTGGGDQITESMRELRASDFADRRAAYLVGRIEQQCAWYARKAEQASRRNNQFLLLTIVLEFVGIVAAVLRITGVISFDLLGILAAAAGGIASWAQTRQWGSLARAYAIAANELSTISGQAREVTEDAWARFVDEAEEAISREHTLWRSSRGVLGRPTSRGKVPADPEL